MTTAKSGAKFGSWHNDAEIADVSMVEIGRAEGRAEVETLVAVVEEAECALFVGGVRVAVGKNP